MNSNFNLQSHPSWDQHNLSKNEYSHILEELANREKGTTLVVGRGFVSVVTRAMAVWQQIKGWLGFENQANPVRVNYALLKMLRYGENHHYFDDQSILEILKNLQQNLLRDTQYHQTTRIIDSILSRKQETPALIERKIVQIFHEEQDQLQEALWPRLYHQYIAPLNVNTAVIQYNLGRIQFSDGKRAEAIGYLERALAIDPYHRDCRDLLAKVLFEEMTDQVEKGTFSEALSTSERILSVLFSEDKSNFSDASSVFLYKFAVEAKLNLIANAMSTLKFAGGSIPDFLRNYEVLTKQVPCLVLTELQRVQLYHEIAQQVCQEGEVDQAAGLLEEALSEQPESLEMRSKIAAHYISLGNYQKALEHLQAAQKYHPQETGILLNLAQCHIGLREFVPAYDYYLRAESILGTPDAYRAEKYFCSVQAAALFVAFGDKYHATVYYKKALDTDPQRGFELAHLLVDVGDAYMREDVNQALFAYRLALPYLERSYVHLKKQSEVYAILAQDAMYRQSYDEALEFYNRALNAQPNDPELHNLIAKCFTILNRFDLVEWHIEKGLSLNPNHAEMLLAKAELFERKNQIEEAIKIYQQLAWLNVNGIPSVQNKKIINMLIQIGDRHYIRGNCYPNNIQQAILNLIDFVHHSEYAKEVELAWGAWFGKDSWQNSAFTSLGKYNDADRVLADGRNAISYLRLAYDGQRNHLRPEQMPNIIRDKIDTLEKQLDEMLDYYKRLEELTDDFLSFIKSSFEHKEITHALGGWMGEYSLENMQLYGLDKKGTTLYEIEERSKVALKLVERAYDGVPPHRLPREMSSALRQKIAALRSFMDEKVSPKHAVSYYLQAYNMDPSVFGDYINRLLEVFYQSNDYFNAIGLYENLIKQFPRNLIHFPVDSYVLYADVLFNNKNYEDALNLLRRGVDLFPENHEIRKKLSHLSFVIAEDLYKNQKNLNRALDYYNVAIGSGVNAEPACYRSLADLYLEKYQTTLRVKNHIEATSQPNAANDYLNLCLSKAQTYKDQAVKYLKKAAKVGKRNSKYQFDYAMALYYEPIWRKTPFKFLHRALDLEPENALYHYGAWHCYIKQDGQDSTIAKQFVALPSKERYVFIPNSELSPRVYIPDPFEMPAESTFDQPLHLAVENNLEADFKAHLRSYTVI